MNIEKALRNYLKGTGPKVKEKDFFEYTRGNGNATFNVLFKLVNEEIDTMNDSKALDRVVEVLKLGETVLRNDDGLNMGEISRQNRGDMENIEVMARTREFQENVNGEEVKNVGR